MRAKPKAEEELTFARQIWYKMPMEYGFLYRPTFGAVTLVVLWGVLRCARRLWLPTGAQHDAGALAESALGGDVAFREGKALATGRPNTATTIALCGNTVGLALIAGAVVDGGVQHHGLLTDAMWVAVYGVTAALLLLVGGRWGVRVILRASLPVEIERGNVAAGIVAAGHVVATAIILSRCIYGTEWATLGISLGFFALAQVTLHLFVVGFRAVTTYDDAEEIRNENVAAALSYAGMTLALGIIIARATDGAFTTWLGSLSAYARSLLCAFILYPVRPILVQGLLMQGSWRLRGAELDRAISPGRDVRAGLLEGCSYVGIAFLLARMG